MKKLRKMLLKDFNYELDKFIVVKRLTPYLKHMVVLILIFFVACLLYFLDIAFINEIVILVILILFFAIPAQLLYLWLNDSYVITEAYLIRHDTSLKYKVIDYDRVSDVTLKDDTVLSFKFDKKAYKIRFTNYDKDLKFLITVFEAKGLLKYDGEYLERPIELEIENDIVKIIELDEVETPTQRLAGSLYDNYESVTPGYFNYVVLHNSIINEATINNGNLYLKLNSIDVKVDHPENTLHEAVQALDVVVVFEDVKSVDCFQKPNNDRNAKNKLVSSDILELPNILSKAVISDSFIEDTDEQMIFRMISSQATMTNTTLIKYKEILVGWKTLGGQSWFEDNDKFGEK